MPNNKRLSPFALLLLLASLVLGMSNANAQLTGDIFAPDEISSLEPFEVQIALYGSLRACFEAFPVNADVTNAHVRRLAKPFCSLLHRAQFYYTYTPLSWGDITIRVPPGRAQTLERSNPIAWEKTIRFVPPADSTPPTVTVTGPSSIVNPNTFEVTVTFSEPVRGFEASEVRIVNGAIKSDGFARSAAGAVYTIQIDPDRNGNVEVTIPADVAEDIASNLNVASNTLRVVENIVPPIVALTGPPGNTSSEETFTISALFTEAIMGFTADDVVVSTGSAEFNGPPTMIFEMVRQSLTITHDGSAPEVVISIPAGSYTDLDGNPSVAQGIGLDTVTVTYTGVSVRLTGAPSGNIDAGFEVTATFTESVAGFTADDIEITNATATVAGSGATYTLTITPDGAIGEIEFGIIADATDGGNAASNRVSVNYDPQPFVTLSGAPSSATGLTPFEVTATFTEDVHRFDAAVGFTLLPIDITSIPVTVTNGMGRVKSHSGRIFVLEITPAGTGDSIDIFLPRNAVIDSAFLGNAPSNEVTVAYIDTAPPTVALTGAATTSELVFEIMAVFSEGIAGFTADDVETNTGTVMLSGTPSVGSEGSVSQTLQITHDGTISNILISIPAGTFTDTKDNLNTIASNTLTVANTEDDTPPTVTFTAPPANHNGTNTFMVTVALSEPADDFIAGDITFSDNATGTLTGSGADYTLTVTPTDTNSVTIDIAAGSFTDPSNNMNTASETLTVTYDAAADTTPPTVARPVAQFSIVEQATSFEVTVTFSEAVTGFDAATDIMVTRGTTLAPVAMGDSGTIYTLAITPDGPSGQIVITIPAGVAMDASGNLNTASPTLSVTYIRPVTVVLSLAEPQFISNGRDPFEVTATFSEPVNFRMDDVMVANGTFTASGNGAVYTLTITPTSDTNDAITIQLLEGAGEVGASGQMLPRDSDASEVLQVMVLHDIIPPTVALMGPDPAIYSSTDAFVVTATFSEAVTGFDAVADITVTNGTAAAPTPVGNSGTTYTLTITPAGMGAITILIPADVAVDGASNGNTASATTSVTYMADTTAPTVVLTAPDTVTDLTAFEVTATFSEDVINFRVGGVMVVNGTATAVNGSGAVYTVTITPDGGNNDAITIQLIAGAAGEVGTGGGQLPKGSLASEVLQVMVLLDTTAPTVTLTAPDAVIGLTAFTVTATFSEAVTGFDAVADITVTNGVAAVPAPVSNSQTDYTLTITPDGMGTITILIPADAAMDGASNGNTASATTSVTYTPPDTTAPTVTLTAPDAVIGLTAFTVTATFSEAVTGFDAVADITVTNGVAAVPAPVSNSQTDYTLTITPDGMGTITILIPADAAMDGASNGNTASATTSVTYTPPDTTAPTVTLTAPDAVTGLTAFTVTATFSEPVTGFDAIADITVTNGVAAVPAPMDNSQTDYTLTITPAGTDGEITITIPADAAVDGASNGNTASATTSVAYTPPDTTPPTVTLTSATTTVSNRTPFTVTATFSEDVTGFDAVADITVDNGIVGRPDDPPAPPVSVDGSARVYTLTITPNTNGNISISIPANAAMDGAGLGNPTSAALIVTYTGMDTTGPSAVLMPSPGSSIGERGRREYFRNSNAVFEVKVKFDEAVRGFGLDDIIIQGGTTSNFMGMDEDAVYKFDVTPSGTGTLQVGIAGSGTDIADLNGNALADTLSLSVRYDVTPPTVALSDYPATANASDTTFAVTATFSEAVPGFNAADITVTNGAVTVSGSGPIYTLTITPDGNDGEIMIAIAASVVTDVAGNANTASTNADSTTPSDPVSVTYDATAPTVELTGAPTTVNSVTTFAVTATFSEAVTGFDEAADITVTGGTAIAPAFVSEGIYTLTITPAGTDGAITITIPENVAADAANNGNTASSAVTVTYDTTPPTVTFTGTDSVSNTNEFGGITLTFGEDVTGLDDDDFMVTNGEFVRFQSVIVNRAFELIIKPDGVGDIIITLMAGAVTDLAAGNANTATAYTVAYDTTNPPLTVVLTVDSTTITDRDFVVTMTTSKRLATFSTDDISIPNGQVQALGERIDHPDGTAAYPLHIRALSLGIVEVTIREGFRPSFDGIGPRSTVSNTLVVTYALPSPTVTFSEVPANHDGTSPFTVTVTLSETATDFVVGDIDFSANATGTLTGSGTDYTLAVTPTDTNSITIDIAAGTFTDAATNPNTASETLTVAYAASADTTPPTVMLSAPDAVNGLDPFAVTATFSEPVIGFDETAITVTNGTVTLVTDLVSSSLAQRSTLTRQLNARATARSSSLAQRYTLTITPDGTGTITIEIPAGAVMDAAGNLNTASTNAAGNTAPVSVTYDATVPTVTLTGPDPATFSNTEAFVVTATFSENVTGFDAVTDITVNNGTAAVPMPVGSSETTYTLTITPDGSNGNIEITIPADVAVDAANNGNTASNTLEVEVDNTIVADTKAAITGFMLDRANKLASNQPGLARFLQGTDCGTFSANSTDASGSVDGCLSNGHTWGEISRTWSSDNAYTLATVGLHGLMRDDLIIGGLVQFDKADDDKRNITGQGWLVGPYFVRKPTDQNMTFEGRLLYGQTDNDISPLGSYTDSFDTERYLAQLRVTGEYGYRIATMMPSLDLTHTEDTQQAYTDTPGNLIDEQGVDLTQLTFGMDFKLPVAIQTGQLDLTGGLSGTYSETNGGESDVEGGRGRTELGLNYSRGSGATMRVGTFYDGISSDHESFGVNFSLDMKF